MLASNPYHARDGQRFGGTVGKALPGVSLRIVHDNGEECLPGEIGSIEVRGRGISRLLGNAGEDSRGVYG